MVLLISLQSEANNLHGLEIDQIRLPMNTDYINLLSSFSPNCIKLSTDKTQRKKKKVFQQSQEATARDSFEVVHSFLVSIRFGLFSYASSPLYEI